MIWKWRIIEKIWNLKKKHKEELEQLMKEMSEEAKKVKEDYKKNPSDMSGSRVHIHENSPLLATREERLLKIDKKA